MPALLLRRRSHRVPFVALWFAAIFSGLRAAEEIPSFFATEAGLPPLRVYSPAEYGGSYQTWTMLSGPDGIVYVGDFGGVLEFDGAKWRRLAPEGLGSVRELAFLNDGRLYLTGNDDFGYCVRDSTGELRYTSLRKELPAEALPLGGIVNLARHGDALYLSTEKGVVRWQPGRTRFWPAPPGSGRAGFFVVGSNLWRRNSRATTITELRNDEWVPILEAPEMQNKLTAFLITGADGLPLFGVNQLGIFQIVDGRLVKWPHAANALLDAARMTNALLLRDNTLAITTVNDGVVLLSRDGKIARQLRMPEGLPSNLTLSLGTDAAGRIWICTYNGLAVFEWPAPLTLFDRRAGFDPSAVAMLQRTPAGLVIGGMAGRFKLTPAAPASLSSASLTRQPGNDYVTATPIEHPAGTLFPSAGGIRALRGDQSEVVCPIDDLLIALTASKIVPGRVYFGSEKGLGSALWRDGRWQVEGYAPHGPTSVRKIVEDTDGSLWARSLTHDAWLVSPPTAGDWKASTGVALKTIPGWPGGVHGTESTPLGVIFAVGGKFFRYDRPSNRFVIEDRIDRDSAPPGDLFIQHIDDAGRIWAAAYPEGTVAGRRHGFGYFAAGTSGRFRWHALSPDLSAAIGTLGVEQVSPDAPNSPVLWLRGTQGVGRLDSSIVQELSAPPPPRLRRVALDDKPQPLAGSMRFAYVRAPLRFEFAPAVGAFGSSRFESRLIGWNSTWTAPTAATEATYSGLGAGTYTFEVRELGAAGNRSLTTRFAFSIAPPWHLSPAAYACYVLAALAAIAVYIRWRLGRAAREQRRLEALVATRTSELATARDAAEAASRAKSAFLASMSHELRTPLNGVIGYAQVLQEDRRLFSDQRERLRIVQNSGEHLLRMINDVLDLAKIEAGKLELRLAPFALADLLRDIIAAHAPAAAAKRLTFTVDLAPDLSPWVAGDAQKLRQILDNLLGNAVKFTASGSVVLRVSPDLRAGRPSSASAAQLIVFAVRDTGPGIDAADQARLFQPFEQATRSRPHAPGAGLGLAISRALVSRLGGSLTLSSEPGRGATFTFAVSLPAVTPDPATTPRARRLVGYEGPRRHVLIVDDNQVNRSLLTDLLTPLGFVCTEFPSGETALAHLSAAPLPDLAILDVRMEGIDGLELTRRLRALPRGPSLKILLTSASVLTFDPAEGRAAGCDDFLPKPFRTADLVDRIGTLLGLIWRPAESMSPFNESVSTSPAAPHGSPLPPALLSQLRELLAQGDLDALRTTLTPARPLHTAAESRLAELDAAAAAFDLPRLRFLIEQP